MKITASTPAIVFHRNLKVIVQKKKEVAVKYMYASLMLCFCSFMKFLPIKKSYWLFRTFSIPQNMIKWVKYKSFLIMI